MNLMEKYLRRFKASERPVIQGDQVIAPTSINALSEEVKDACEERAAIMEHNGELSKEQADKYDWCREICMLTKGQATLCERVKPCPKYSAGQ
jgi:undecaprenyl pyrophosphate synthase